MADQVHPKIDSIELYLDSHSNKNCILDTESLINLGAALDEPGFILIYLSKLHGHKYVRCVRQDTRPIIYIGQMQIKIIQIIKIIINTTADSPCTSQEMAAG